MTPEQQTGLMLLCLTCGAPFFIGFALAWWYRGRVEAYGLVGALLPALIRDRI